MKQCAKASRRGGRHTEMAQRPSPLEQQQQQQQAKEQAEGHQPHAVAAAAAADERAEGAALARSLAQIRVVDVREAATAALRASLPARLGALLAAKRAHFAAERRRANALAARNKLESLSEEDVSLEVARLLREALGAGFAVIADVQRYGVHFGEEWRRAEGRVGFPDVVVRSAASGSVSLLLELKNVPLTYLSWRGEQTRWQQDEVNELDEEKLAALEFRVADGSVARVAELLQRAAAQARGYSHVSAAYAFPRLVALAVGTRVVVRDA